MTPSLSYSHSVLTTGKASHITHTPGDTATFVFQVSPGGPWWRSVDTRAEVVIDSQGTYVAFRSTVSTDQGVEEAILDGKSYLVDTTWEDRSISGSPRVVFEKGGLSPGKHTLVIKKTSQDNKITVVW